MDVKRLKEILKIQSSSKDETRMVAYLKEELKKIQGLKVETDTAGNIYVTKGQAELYPVVVSHMDTVHQIHEKVDVYESHGSLFAFSYKTKKQVGTGGDDKVGIFICLEMLNKFDNIKLVFFSQEEIGCVGSGKANMDFFKDASFVSQSDRKGFGDFVRYGCGVQLFSEEFEKEIEPIIKKWGFKSTTGGLTDVVELKEKGLDVCCFNMSCGYYNPHSDRETVNISEVEKTMNMVEDIIKNLSTKKWEHVPITKKYSAVNSWNTDVTDYNRAYRNNQRSNYNTPTYQPAASNDFAHSDWDAEWEKAWEDEINARGLGTRVIEEEEEDAQESELNAWTFPIDTPKAWAGCEGRDSNKKCDVEKVSKDNFWCYNCGCYVHEANSEISQ
jgi:hypothetical protein